MIVLDTVTLIRLATESGDVSPVAHDFISSASTRLVSAITAWEIAMLVGKGRITLDRPVDDWVDDAMTETDSDWVDLTPGIAALSAQLPGAAPADPADRMIIATALATRSALATPDRRLIEYPFAPTVW